MAEEFGRRQDSSYDGPYGEEDAPYGSQQQQPSGNQTSQQESYGSQEQQQPGYGDGQTQDNLGADPGYGQQKAQSGYGTGGTEGAFNAPSYGSQDQSTGDRNDDQSSGESEGDRQTAYDQSESGSVYGQTDAVQDVISSGQQKKDGGLVGKLEGAFTDNDAPSSDSYGGNVDIRGDVDIGGEADKATTNEKQHGFF